MILLARRISSRAFTPTRTDSRSGSLPDPAKAGLTSVSRPAPRCETSQLDLRYQSRPDRSWRHKWIERSALAEAGGGSQPGPAVLHLTGSPHDITETTRGNLFLQDQDGLWCTPPLDEQVLPGVTRREVLDLLDDRRTPARIRRCSVQELRQSRGAFWTSSLSGAVPITAVDGTALPDVSEFTAELNHQLGIC